MSVGKSVIDKIGETNLVDGFKIVLDHEKSHGSYIFDKVSGKEILDLGYNQFGSLPIGYNHPDIDESFKQKLSDLSEFRVANSDVYSEEYAEFVDSLQSIIPSEFTHYFFIDGGALAVENTLKAAFDWKTRLNNSKGLDINGDKILHFKNSFHGRSGYTLSLTNTADPRKYEKFPKFDWPRVHNPVGTFYRNGNVEYDNEELAREQIENAFKNNPHSIAGIIIEPIQGEGGDGYFRPDFFNYLREISDENDALLIFDEVQTGWSTGDWWALGRDITSGVLPDLFAFSKKTQQAGIASTNRIDEVENNVFNTSSRINSTWGGDLRHMLTSVEYMKIIKDNNLLENSKKIGNAIQDYLKDLDEEIVSNIRGVGGWQAFTLPSTKIRDKVWKEAYKNNVLVLKSGIKSIRVRPNLATTLEEVDKGMSNLGDIVNNNNTV